ncbi:hypothetical protein V8C37DRAFT_384555 [Trichoderma ceciliae]
MIKRTAISALVLAETNQRRRVPVAETASASNYLGSVYFWYGYILVWMSTKQHKRTPDRPARPHWPPFPSRRAWLNLKWGFMSFCKSRLLFLFLFFFFGIVTDEMRWRQPPPSRGAQYVPHTPRERERERERTCLCLCKMKRARGDGMREGEQAEYPGASRNRNPSPPRNAE